MKLRIRTSEPNPGVTGASAPVSLPERPAIDLHIDPGGKRLGEQLVAAGLCTTTQVIDALRVMQDGDDRRIGRVLVDSADLDDRDLAILLSRRGNFPFIDLRHVSPDPVAVALLAEKVSRTQVALPLEVRESSVLVAVADPSPNNVALLREAIGQDVDVAVAAEADIVLAIGNSYRALADIGSQVTAFEARDSIRKDAARTDEFDALAANENGPVVQVVQLIIAQGLRDRASDIHIENHQGRVRVRFRIDGALHDVLDLPGSMGPAIASRIKILAEMNIVERRRAQDGQISMTVEGKAVDVRVATIATISGEKVVMRLLDKSRPLFKLSQLGMAEDTAARYSALLHAPFGMLICAGPTGSGKTTTLYGSLGEINDTSRNIMTIEDPVEYTFSNINQIQINEQAGVTFAGGLKSILRQDPDIILVGEVRDVDTARIAVQSALTGHLVLSSLHATDSVSALLRLLDMGIEPFLVASSVSAVVAQRLVRRICTYCRAPYSLPEDELEFMRMVNARIPADGYFRGTGCNFCAHTGYLERIGVYQLLEVTEAIRTLILRRASHDKFQAVAQHQGMRSLLEDACLLIETGVTTISEVIRSIYVVGT